MRCVGRKFVLLIGVAMCVAAAEAMARSPGLLAQALPPVPQSYAAWMIQSLGLFGLLMLLSGVAVFIGACLVVSLARRPAVIASYLVFLLLPLLFSAVGALKGSVASFAVLAVADVQIKQSQIFAGLSEALLLPLSALMITLPSYFVVAVGLF
ncbi:MAG: hypothetical protein ABSG68_12085, partial [Thermoguttaceae bacterium]